MALQLKTFRAKDGAEIKYVDEGSGIPMLFIYGIGSTIESQTAFIEAARQRGRIIVFDHRAFGATPAAGQMGIDQSARDAQDLLDHLKIEKAVLYGYSMGAATVLSYLTQFGCERVKKVIIGDMSPKLINEGDWKLGLYQGWYTREMYEQDLELIKTDYKRYALILAEQLLFKNYPDKPRDFSGTAEEIRSRILSRRSDLIAKVLLHNLVDLTGEHIQANCQYCTTMVSADFRPVLKNITVPTALVYADPGSGFCPAAAEYMHTQIPDSTLFPVPDSTHMAGYEKPVEWCGHIFKFAFS